MLSEGRGDCASALPRGALSVVLGGARECGSHGVVVENLEEAFPVTRRELAVGILSDDLLCLLDEHLNGEGRQRLAQQDRRALDELAVRRSQPEVESFSSLSHGLVVREKYVPSKSTCFRDGCLSLSLARAGEAEFDGVGARVMSQVDWLMNPLERTHDRTAFDCGEGALNGFLRNYARQNQTENVGRTWVATLPGERVVLGFYTLTVASVAREHFSAEELKRVPRYPVPVAHLGRLAVDRTAQKTGLGEHLLTHALEQILRVSRVVGIFAVEVRAKNERARRFYERYGFKVAEDDGLHLYLSVKTLEKIFVER